MGEWINPYQALSPNERHLELSRLFWAMPNREIEYQRGADADENISKWVSAQYQTWQRRKVSQVRFEALEETALLLQLSSGTVPFRIFVYRQYDFLTIHGIVRDEQALTASLIDFFGPNKRIQEHHSSPVFPICDLGNPRTEGIFGEQTVQDCEQRGYRYMSESNLMYQMIAEEHGGPGAYARLPGVVKLKMIEEDQEWYREFVRRYQDTP